MKREYPSVKNLKPYSSHGWQWDIGSVHYRTNSGGEGLWNQDTARVYAAAVLEIAQQRENDMNDNANVTGHGFKFLNPYGATEYGGEEFFYPLPLPGQKWGEWIEHPDPGRYDGYDCGPGRLHVMNKLTAEYAPANWWVWFAEWRGLIGGSDEKVGVREIRLRRITKRVFWRIIRMGHCAGMCLRGADLCGADLYSADLSGANLSGANLSGADLSGANLRGANLSGANLSGANLRDANLYNANLYGADLRDADLRGANLRGANLYNANLYGADLRDANLSGADLRGANLRGANLRGADLCGADLYGSDLSGTVIEAIGLPKGE